MPFDQHCKHTRSSNWCQGLNCQNELARLPDALCPLSASENRYVENGVIYIHLARETKSVSMPFDEFMELVGLIPAIQENTPVLFYCKYNTSTSYFSSVLVFLRIRHVDLDLKKILIETLISKINYQKHTYTLLFLIG